MEIPPVPVNTVPLQMGQGPVVQQGVVVGVRPLEYTQQPPQSAYEAYLMGASSLTLTYMNQSCCCFRCCVDDPYFELRSDSSPKEVLTLRFKREKEYLAYSVNVLLDNEVVQTVTGPGGLISHPPGQSIDRGDGQAISISSAPGNKFCCYQESALIVSRESGDNTTKLVAYKHLNSKFQRRQILDLLLAIPTIGVGTVCCMICCAPPSLHYGLEGGSGGEELLIQNHTFCKTQCCLLGGMPDGSVIKFGAANVIERRDMVLIAANHIGTIASPRASA